MKDYKKILEDIANIISSAEKSDVGFDNICAYIGENCPELKESEDERIRKALVDIFSPNNKKNCHDEISNEQILAWLEKQNGTSRQQKVEEIMQEMEDTIVQSIKPIFKIGDTIVEKDIDECGYGTIKDIKDGQYIFTDGSGMSINEQNSWQPVEQKPVTRSGKNDKVEWYQIDHPWEVK